MKPQDTAIALQLILLPEAQRARPTNHLAGALGLSTSQVHASLQRLRAAGIVSSFDNFVVRPSLVEYLEHGIRYAAPLTRGAPARGVATAADASPLSGRFAKPAAGHALVWPDPSGDVEGIAVEPVHRIAPRQARDNPDLYELLTLVDGLRIHDPRIREAAAEELRARLGVEA